MPTENEDNAQDEGGILLRCLHHHFITLFIKFIY